MFEKVNPSHPDKLADRIAGAIVDLAYSKAATPTIAVEVLLGNNNCFIIIEHNLVPFTHKEIDPIVGRILNYPPGLKIVIVDRPQNIHLENNQKDAIRCGDNGIFKGEPETLEEHLLTSIAKDIYKEIPTDGKYILDCATSDLIICQSNDNYNVIQKNYPMAKVNPLGYWTGGMDVDAGATNRKLGSDMGRSVTGGGLHGKDASKADVSINIFVWLMAQRTNKTIEAKCAIGDEFVLVNNEWVAYEYIVNEALAYIDSLGGFEKFAEWGLIR